MNKRFYKKISCHRNVNFDGRKCNSNQKWKNDKCCECNTDTSSCENVKYLAYIIVDSVITCDKIIAVEAKSYDEERKAVTTSINENSITCKTQIFYILLVFLLITIALLLTVTIYCYLIKHRTKQKHL